jgi:hypothetical protein
VSGAGGTCKVADNFFLVGSSHDCSSSLCHLILADGSLSDYQASGPVFSMLPVLLGQWLERRLLVGLFFFPVQLVMSTMLLRKIITIIQTK